MAILLQKNYPMSIPGILEHNEDFLFDYTREEYFHIVRKAVEQLNWHQLSADNYTIVCHTRGGGLSHGESVTIDIQQGIVHFHSHSVNEYETVNNPNIANAEQFKAQVASVAAHSKELEKKMSRFSGSVFSALVPSKTFLVTPILIYLNIAVFAIMVVYGVSFISPDTQSLLNWGGNFRPSTMYGEWWRLITSMFVHAGFIHLLMNMYGLLYIGVFLEPMIGKLRFAAAYLLAGIFASLASLMVHSCTVSVGASGAIFGMYGLFLSLLTTNHIEKNARNTLLKSIGIFIALNLMNGVKGNIDNACHVGGLISGFIIGYIYYPGIRANVALRKQLLVTAYMAVVALLATFITVNSVHDEYAVFQKNVVEMSNMESMALEVLHMKGDVSGAQLMYGLNDRGIYYWKECIKLTEENKKLNLPSNLLNRNEKMQVYYKARVKMYKILCNQLRATGKIEESPELKDEIAEIQKLMDDIKGGL